MWHLTSLLSRPHSVLSLQTNKRIKRKKMGARLAFKKNFARDRLKTPEKMEKFPLCDLIV
jgi:hypothetical protein